MGHPRRFKKLPLPPPPIDPTESMYPARIRQLFQVHGFDAVCKTGLETLGYPPLWAQTGKEILAVVNAVEAAASHKHSER